MSRRLTSGWISAYMAWLDESEAPDSFHLWTAMTILGAAMRRNAFIRRGYYTLWPNFFTVLVAKTGRCRKSSAMEAGVVNLLNKVDEVLVISDKMTTEGLIETLSQHVVMAHPQMTREATGLVFASEFAVLIHHDTKMVGFLTDIYNSREKWLYTTRTKGKVELSGICVSLLAGSAPEWLKLIIPIGAVGGGFTSRIIFVYEEDRRRSIARPKQPDEKLGADLLADLKIITTLQGEFKLSPAAGKLFDDWYNSRGLPEEEETQGFAERVPDHALKSSMIWSIQERDDFVIDVSHITSAIACVEEVEQKLPRVFAGIGESLEASVTERVSDVLRHADQGMMTRKRMLRKLKRHTSAKQLDSIILTLVEAGEVEEEVIGATRIYKWIGK